MKKKFVLFVLLAVCIFPTFACGNKAKMDLNNYLIEERNNLFVANDELYTATLSTGKREKDYALDGVINEKMEFGILTFSRNDNLPLANDSYNYVVTIGEENLTGTLERDNETTFSIDLEREFPADSEISVQVNFTGYSFGQNFTNVSKDFAVDKTGAIKIANKELEKDLKNLTSNKNAKIEVVMKILKDHSTEDVKTYYWYVGAISTTGETLGILIDANTGNIVAKKV